jgi:glucose-1-phosphate thymidylyltransferase
VEIVEKPTDPPSRFAVIGIYMYDRDVFDIAKTLSPSDRGELEITDVNNVYIRRGDLTFSMLDGWWTDAGTFESLHRANCLVAQGGANRIDAPAGCP